MGKVSYEVMLWEWVVEIGLERGLFHETTWLPSYCIPVTLQEIAGNEANVPLSSFGSDPINFTASTILWAPEFNFKSHLSSLLHTWKLG